MRPIRVAFWAGLAVFAVGAVLLALSVWLGRQPAEGAPRTLHNVLALTALLLTTCGGFLALCTGAVVVLNLLTEPRTARRQS